MNKVMLIALVSLFSLTTFIAITPFDEEDWMPNHIIIQP